MNTPAQSIVLVGTAYSGSTILGMALNSAKNNATYIGELSRSHGLFEKYQLDREPGVCSACQIEQKNCPIYTDNLFQKFGNKTPTEIHKYLIKHLKTKTVIDASKHIAWVRLLAQETPTEKIKVIITVKNPKNYVQSCLDRGTDTAWQAANAWRDTYIDILRTLNRLGIAYYVVRNESYIANTEQTMKGVWNFLHFQPTKYSQEKQVHAIGGNPAARITEVGNRNILETAKRLGQQLFDLNPQKASPLSKQKISYDTQVLFDTPGLNDLANLLGYEVKDIV